jgi:polysaccharide export outer membrane protein
MASEVSPYSRYSPYIEVVGEGSNYTLGVDDVVTVIVRNQPDFSGRFVIDPEGNIQYNFAGDIKAAGKSKEELKVEIMERLRKFVRYPEVAVMISEYRSKAVYVFGFVNRPGKYAMKGDKITLKEAVVAAGLPRVDAAMKRVYVIRPSQYTENGKSAKRKVDLKKLLQKGDSAEDFMLEPGDTIVIDQKNFDRFVNAFSRIVGPVFQAAAVYELGFGGDGNGFLRPDKTG